ncbi:MAG: AI-2E family transporter [Candidatus Xenobia bacterium]
MPANETLKRRLLLVTYLLVLIVLGSFLLAALVYIRPAVILLSCCILLAYLLTPIVRTLEGVLPGKAGHGKRLAAILLSYLLIGGGFSIALAYILPMVGRELHHLTVDLQARHFTPIDDLTAWLTDRLPPEAAEGVPQYVQQAADQIRQQLLETVRGSLPMVTKFFSGLVELFLAPVLTLFLLLDLETYKRGFLRIFPLHRRVEMLKLLGELDEVLSGFVLGQLMVAVVMGSSIALVLFLLHVRYALLLGIFAGLVDIIPYLGVPLGMIPAFFVAYSFQGIYTALATIALMECLHMTEGKLVVPTVVGHSVKLPPLVVLVSIFIGAQLLGIVGMLLAIPLVGMGKVIVNHCLPADPPATGTASAPASRHLDLAPSLVATPRRPLPGGLLHLDRSEKVVEV